MHLYYKFYLYIDTYYKLCMNYIYIINYYKLFNFNSCVFCIIIKCKININL